jgi:hypothetical protein
MSEQEILEEHPDLEVDGFPAVYQYVAEMGRKQTLSIELAARS